MDLLGYGLDDADDDVLQSLSLRVIVQDEAVSLLRICAAEWRRTHARVDGTQVVMESIQVLEQEEPLLLYRYWSICKLYYYTPVKELTVAHVWLRIWYVYWVPILLYRIKHYYYADIIVDNRYYYYYNSCLSGWSIVSAMHYDLKSGQGLKKLNGKCSHSHEWFITL